MIIENVRIKSARLQEPNDDGRYQVIFAIDDEDARQELVDLIDAHWDENKPKGAKKNPKSKPYFMSETSDEYPDADEDTDTIIFLASKKSESKDGKELHVDVYDDNGVKYKQEDIPSVGAGTVGNISIDLFTWTFKGYGISMWMNKFQVVDLKEFSGGDTFGAVKGKGFKDEKKSKKNKKNKKNKKEQ